MRKRTNFSPRLTLFLLPQFLHPAVNISFILASGAYCDRFFSEIVLQYFCHHCFVSGFFFLPKKTSYERKKLHLMESFFVSWI